MIDLLNFNKEVKKHPYLNTNTNIYKIIHKIVYDLSIIDTYFYNFEEHDLKFSITYGSPYSYCYNVKIFKGNSPTTYTEASIASYSNYNFACYKDGLYVKSIYMDKKNHFIGMLKLVEEII